MASPESQAASEVPFVPYTKAERIQQLNDIDKSVTSLLQSAGLALQSLTASQEQRTQSADKREAFKATANAYLQTLQAVDVRLQRQILGLEEADIIPKETPQPKQVTTEKNTQTIQVYGARKAQEVAKETISISEGSLGKLDSGWLNSRSGRVGWGMEAELWEKARGFLEEVENGKVETQSAEEDHPMGD